MKLNSTRPLVLLFGDLFGFIASLYLALLLRTGTIPLWQEFFNHLIPFTAVFCVWIIVFFVSGLYERRAAALRRDVVSTVIRAQFVNAGLAAIFFYLIPIFGIAPKTMLFIQLALSSVFIIWWRTSGFRMLRPFARKSHAVLIASGDEARDLFDEVNGSNRFRFSFVDRISLDRADSHVESSLFDYIQNKDVSIVVVDTHDARVGTLFPRMHEIMFKGVRFVRMHDVYEEVFDRVPLSLVREQWFLENISGSASVAYDVLKRLMDVVIAGTLGVLSLVVYPFVALAIKIEDKGDVFIRQNRIGRGGKTISMLKFRSMKSSDGGKWVVAGDNRITRVGKFIRASRIDELPQLWSVVKGDMSLIGPRPDIYDLGVKLSEEIPYYRIRSLVAPGLSGWAQIRQEFPPQSLEETKIRLSYDFYYVKSRSITLDLKIALQTIKTLLMRVGK